MEQRTVNMLEFSRVLQHLSKEAVSRAGQQACLDTSAIKDPDRLAGEQELLREMISCREEYGPVLNAFPDITSRLDVLSRPDTVLDIEDFWDFSAFLSEAERLLSYMQGIDAQKFPMLSAGHDNLIWPDSFAAALKRCIGPAGKIRDDSSPGLQSVRLEIRSIRQQCAGKVNESLAQSDISHYLQDEYLTISSDRYVLALKANFKGRLQGIIHDYSQTGETCYFEPFFLTELNNKLQKLKRKEREELQAVLRYLSSLCRQSLEAIKTTFEWLVGMDYYLAKARFAELLSGRPLDISDNNSLRLKNIRHPLLVLGGFSVTPIDIELRPEQHALVISGGNAGGKTVCLKTLGLAALMALCALPVPADQGSTIPMWNKIFVSMVSQQSVEDSLSTFTAQVDHFVRFQPLIDDKTLVILDEFGVGTDPSQGAALAQAVLDRLVQKKAWVATATHFPALKAYALAREDVRAASVLFDEQTGKPLYRIAYDQVGSSLALDVAREQGLPQEIIARAEKYLLVEGQDQDRIFSRLNSLAVQREKELEELRIKRTELEKRFKKKEQELTRQKDMLLNEIRSGSREIISQWKKQKIGRKKALQEMSLLKNRLGPSVRQPEQESEAILPWDQIKPGDKYLYKPWNRFGVVQEKDDKKQQLKIDLGGISLWDEAGSLAESPDISEQKAGAQPSAAQKSIPVRLDLRGRYAQEALAELDHYLDQAILSGRKNLEIVHGKGTGALRAAVHEHLKDNPVVAGFRCATEESGGAGMTEVELR